MARSMDHLKEFQFKKKTDGPVGNTKKVEHRQQQQGAQRETTKPSSISTQSRKNIDDYSPGSPEYKSNNSGTIAEQMNNASNDPRRQQISAQQKDRRRLIGSEFVHRTERGNQTAFERGSSLDIADRPKTLGLNTRPSQRKHTT